MTKREVSLGDEVLIAGLFSRHSGKRQNIPIVRVGNLSCMANERISTRMGDMDAFLIEARSIGGLSGSPVFLQLGGTRTIGGGWSIGTVEILFCGIIHGHYDVDVSAVDGVADYGYKEPDRVNTGIAIVTPYAKVKEVIDSYLETINFTGASILPEVKPYDEDEFE